MNLNCKGFILIETMIVALFVVGIFTFLYSSIVPLLGTYENLIARENIDTVYKLYHIKKHLYSGTNYDDVIIDSYGNITCDSYSDKAHCQTLINFLDLDDGYELIYANNLLTSKEEVKRFAKSDTLKEYIEKFNKYNNVLFLYDDNSESVAHLKLN